MHSPSVIQSANAEVDEQAANARRSRPKRLAQSPLRLGRQVGNVGSETGSVDVARGGSLTGVAGSEPVLFGTK